MVFLSSLILAASPALALGEGDLIQLHIVAGQSNAVGYGADPAELPPELQQPRPDIPFWFVIGPQESIADPSLRVDSGGEMVPLRIQTDPTGATFGNRLTGFGPELSLGQRLAEATGAEIAIFKFAINDSNMALDWYPYDPSSLYAQMLVEIDSAIDALEADGYTVELGSFSWMQGESDALDAGHAWLYEWNLEELVHRLRIDLQAPELPVVVGMLNQFIDGEDEQEFPYLYVLRDAQRAAHRMLGQTILVDTDRLTVDTDDVHFDAAGQIELGELFARGSWSEVDIYCTTQTNSQGCNPAVEMLGAPSLSSSQPFWIRAQLVLNEQPGILFYGLAPAAAPFQGGTLCVFPPLLRTPVQFSGGNSELTDCSGAFAFDFRSFADSGTDPTLQLGTTVYAQYWYRDPAAPFGTGLTDAVSFTLAP